MSEPFKDECPFCRSVASIEMTNHNNDEDVLCPSCGRYTISWQAKRIISKKWGSLEIESAQNQIKHYLIDHKKGINLFFVDIDAIKEKIFITPVQD